MPSYRADARGPDRRATKWRVSVLLCLAIGPYLNALSNDLVYDDHALITENAQVRSLDPRDVLRPGLGRYAVEWYRPLTMYSFAVNYRLGASDPVGYHVVNVLLHAACVVLVYGLALKILDLPAAAGVAAGLFAVHPIHVEAVTPASGRADLLAALFVLLAWYTALDGRASRWSRAVGVAGASFAALLAKEIAIVVWPLIAISDLAGVGLPEAASPMSRLRARYRIHVALALALAAYLLLRMVVTGNIAAAEGSSIRPLENPLVGVGAAVRLATAVWVLVKYCTLLLMCSCLGGFSVRSRSC
jgi:hypothetical protein